MTGRNEVRLTFTGHDKDLRDSFDRVGHSADGFGRGLARLGVAAAAAGVAVAAAAVKFGIDSVKAFVEAETAQAKLQDAFARFPKLADTNITALRKLNTELAKKTRFDDDATATGQAVLAQYKVTGAQLKILTPLMQDYAAKTGRDLPSAAEALGKALLGQGRALKEIGINFKDTGTLAGNFDELVAGLRTQVGGFAEVEGQTAAGKLEILKNRFGELQESIGARLLPVLVDAGGGLEGILDKADDLAPTIGHFVTTELSGLKSALVDLKDNVLGGVADGFDDIKLAVDGNSDSWRKMIDTTSRAIEVLGPVVKAVVGYVIYAGAVAIAWVAQLIEWISKLIEWLKKAAEWIERLGRAKVSGVLVPKTGTESMGTAPKKFHSGGVVPGPLGSEQLAILQGGERVIPAGAAGGSGGTTVIELRSSGARVDDLLLELMRHALKPYGGNIQLAVGRA